MRAKTGFSRTLLAAVLACLAASAACGGKGPTQPPPPPEGPYTACPANFELESPDGNPVTVQYGLPGASGGTAPLTVACTPASGAVLAVGAHPVTCTVTDALQRTASCTFTITVKAPPRLTLTEFVAFGDSLTWGVFREPVPQSFRGIVPPPPSEAYPNQLEQLLRARYRLQTPTVYNEGVGGENVDPGGIERFPSALAAHPTEVVLLMEGTNDLLGPSSSHDAAIEGLRRMIIYAKERNVRVLLATIPPQREGGRRDRVAKIIPGFNDRIRELAASQAVPVVDVYNALKDKMYLISVDDLHPTAQGYVEIARTFFDVIRRELEPAPPAS